MIVFNCPHCNLEIKVPDQAAGRTGTCPKCNAKVRVPGQGFSLDPVPAAPASAAAPVPAGQVPCPYCGEMIAAQAKKCRFCGEFIEGAAPAGQIPCPSCGEMISPMAAQCRFCGEPLGQTAAPARRSSRQSRYADDEDDYAPAPRPRDTGRYPSATRGTGRHPAASGTGRHPSVRNTGRHPSVRGGGAADKEEKSEWDKGFGDYVGVFCFSKFADFSGRATRKEFWFFVLFMFLATIVSCVLAMLLGFPYIPFLVELAFLVPGLSLSWRRCHDVNWSGAMSLIPFVGWIVGFLPGTEGPNQYGPDPYGDDGNDDYDDDYDDRRVGSRRRR